MLDGSIDGSMGAWIGLTAMTIIPENHIYASQVKHRYDFGIGIDDRFKMNSE